MNMFKKVKAKTMEEYLADVPADRQEAMKFLDGFIRKAAPKLEPHFANNMLGYGTFKYKSAKGTVGDWHVIGLANQKNYISVYVCSIVDGKYVAETYKKELGDMTVGKSCISFKKLEDVNLPVLKKVIQTAAKQPGFGFVEKSTSKK